MAVSKTVYTNQSDGRFIVVLLSGTEAEVLQALADEKVDKEHLLNIATDNTFAVYYKKV